MSNPFPIILFNAVKRKEMEESAGNVSFPGLWILGHLRFQTWELNHLIATWRTKEHSLCKFSLSLNAKKQFILEASWSHKSDPVRSGYLDTLSWNKCFRTWCGSTTHLLVNTGSQCKYSHNCSWHVISYWSPQTCTQFRRFKKKPFAIPIPLVKLVSDWSAKG